MTRLWSFLINTFEVATRNSFRKMLLLATDHFDKLNGEKSDPLIAEIIEESEGAFEEYESAYSDAKAVLGDRKGKTLIFTDLLAELQKTWLPAWEVKVLNFYPKNTPEFVTIFPENRSAFHSTAYDEILMALNTLAKSMSAFEPLKDLVTEVKDKTALLKNARQTQGAVKGKTGLYSDELEQKRLALAAALYGNLGALMRIYQDNPAQIERYFKMSLLRRGSSKDGGVMLTAKVLAGGLVKVDFPADLKVNAETTYTLNNLSAETTLWVYFADNPDTLNPEQKVVVNPGESVETTAGNLGWSAEKPLLLVRNAGFAAADVEVTVYVQ